MALEVCEYVDLKFFDEILMKFWWNPPSGKLPNYLLIVRHPDYIFDTTKYYHIISNIDQVEKGLPLWCGSCARINLQTPQNVSSNASEMNS